MKVPPDRPCPYNELMLRWIHDLKRRRLEPELMDDPALAPASHHAALGGLERINRLSFSIRRIWNPIAALARKHPEQTIKVLDVATGAGDIPIGLWQRAYRAGLKIEVAGCDASDRAIQFAQNRAKAHKADVHFFQIDAVAQPLPEGYDVVTCSLFLHHLQEHHVIALLAAMSKAAAKMIVISDLNRTAMGYALAVVVTRLLTRSKVVHTDGPLSVAGAFTMEEAHRLAQKAGLAGASLHRIFPSRWRLIWHRETSS